MSAYSLWINDWKEENPGKRYPPAGLWKELCNNDPDFEAHYQLLAGEEPDERIEYNTIYRSKNDIELNLGCGNYKKFPANTEFTANGANCVFAQMPDGKTEMFSTCSDRDLYREQGKYNTGLLFTSDEIIERLS